jgi:predicted flavoprotein YhiN
LTRYPLRIDGSEGYKKAEVTGGGLPLEQIDCKTMESKVGNGGGLISSEGDQRRL